MLFIDATLQKEFDLNGYVILDFLSLEEIDNLQKIYEGIQLQKKEPFQVSIYNNDVEKNKFIDQEIKNILKSSIQKYFQNYRLLQGLFYIKYPDKKSSFYIHKDWSLVDESKYTSLHIWTPLIDTNKKNGNLFICPSDYKKQFTYRGSPGFEIPKPSLLDKIRYKLNYKDVFLKKGQAICFDHKLTHGSNTNTSNKTRVAAGISLVPAEAELIHYHLIDKKTIEKYILRDSFYIDFNLKEMNETHKISKSTLIHVQ